MLTHLVLLFKYILELRQIQSLIWRNIFCNHDHHENYLLKGFWQLGDLDDRGLPQRPTSFLQNDDVDDDNGNDDDGGGNDDYDKITILILFIKYSLAIMINMTKRMMMI